MFTKGQYYRIVKVDMVAFDALRVTNAITTDQYEVLNTAIEGEEYPDSESWVKTKAEKDKLASEYYKAKKSFDHECYMLRHKKL